MKKYFILAFTFLCLLTGQNSRASDYDDFTFDDYEFDDVCECYDLGTLDEVIIYSGSSDDNSSDDADNNMDSDSGQDWGTEDWGNDDWGNDDWGNDDPLDWGDWNWDDTEPDDDDEDPCTKTCDVGYNLENCECVKVPCTTTCDSGYKLNEETCECELLPPCFGTTVEGLMPDGSGDQSQLVKALETMVNSFFKSADLLDTMKSIGILDTAELSEGFDNYIKGGDLMGMLSIGFVANDYNNNPTTENFMKIIVEGALLFLPPPASVGYTALDNLYQQYFDGKPFSEVLAKNMAESSAELFDCDLGSGVYGLIH